MNNKLHEGKNNKFDLAEMVDEILGKTSEGYLV